MNWPFSILEKRNGRSSDSGRKDSNLARKKAVPEERDADENPAMHPAQHLTCMVHGVMCIVYCSKTRPVAV